MDSDETAVIEEAATAPALRHDIDILHAHAASAWDMATRIANAPDFIKGVIRPARNGTACPFAMPVMVEE